MTSIRISMPSEQSSIAYFACIALLMRLLSSSLLSTKSTLLYADMLPVRAYLHNGEGVTLPDNLFLASTSYKGTSGVCRLTLQLT